jgi:hypothetical protein
VVPAAALGRLVARIPDQADTGEEEDGAEDTEDQYLFYAFVAARAIDDSDRGYDEANNAHYGQDDTQNSFFHILLYKVIA